MTLETWELRSYIVTVIGLPFAVSRQSLRDGTCYFNASLSERTSAADSSRMLVKVS